MERTKENSGIALIPMIIIIVIIAIIIVGLLIFFFKFSHNENNINTNTYETEYNEEGAQELTENEFVNSEYENEDEDDNEIDDGSISWNTLFPDGGSRISITLKEERDTRAFKMDFPGNYELAFYQRSYEGQTIKDLVEETGNIKNNVWVQGDDADMHVRIETSQTTHDETLTQKAERKNPDGFALGTEEHPAWAYQSSGEITLYYQGGQNYALIMYYDNSDAIDEYGTQAVAEFLYNMISYTEN